MPGFLAERSVEFDSDIHICTVARLHGNINDGSKGAVSLKKPFRFLPPVDIPIENPPDIHSV